MARVTENKLNEKQEMFCREYIKDLNGTQAAIRAGYSEKTSAEQASRLLNNVNIKNKIEELKQEREIRVKIDADYVLTQAVKLHQRCMQEVKIKKIGLGMFDTTEDKEIAGVYEFNANAALKALELIGKHISVSAFKENVQHSGDIGIVWHEERYAPEQETE